MKLVLQGLKPTSFHWLYRHDWSHVLLQSDGDLAQDRVFPHPV